MTEQPSKSILSTNGRQSYVLANSSEVPPYAIMVIREAGNGKLSFFNRTGIIKFDIKNKTYSLTVNGSTEKGNATEFVTGIG